MIDIIIVGALFALGVLVSIGLAFLIVSIVTWPFDLKAEVSRQKSLIKRLDSHCDEYRKFINSKNLDGEYRRFK